MTSFAYKRKCVCVVSDFIGGYFFLKTHMLFYTTEKNIYDKLKIIRTVSCPHLLSICTHNKKDMIMTINEMMTQLNKDFLNFSVQMTGGLHDGQDLLQEAKVKAIETQYIFDEMTSHQVKVWFFKTIKNKYIDGYRKAERRKKLLVGEVTVKDFQDAKVLKLMLNVLSTEERKIINLKYYGGYTSNEISTLIKMNASTVRNRLSSALSTLRVAYEAD